MKHLYVFSYLKETLPAGRPEVSELVERRRRVEQPAEIDDRKSAAGDDHIGAGLLRPDIPCGHQLVRLVPSLRERLHVGHLQMPSGVRVRHGLCWFLFVLL